MKQGVRGLTLIDDAYNSDLTSLDIALDFLARRKEPHHRSVLVLSDFQQSGIDTEVLYRRVAALLAPRQVDLLIGVGTDVRRLDGQSNRKPISSTTPARCSTAACSTSSRTT